MLSKYRVECVLFIHADNEDMVRATIQHSFYETPIIRKIEKEMTTLEKFEFWQQTFREDVAGKDSDVHHANPFHIMSYMDAAFAAKSEGAIDDVTCRAAWIEVKDWIL